MADTASVPLVSLFTEVDDPRRSPEADLAGTFLELPYGIPSHDTFGRVFARLDPQQLEGCFARWVQSLAAALRDQVVSVESKAARRSHNASRVYHPCIWSVLGRAQRTWSWASSG